jgi:hypothetical protein
MFIFQFQRKPSGRPFETLSRLWLNATTETKIITCAACRETEDEDVMECGGSQVVEMKPVGA